MPFANSFAPVNFINKSVTPTGTPDIDAAWLNYVQAVIDAQGDGLATYSSDLETLEATVTALGTPYTDHMYINGLDVEWISATSIRVKSGGCYLPATNRIVTKSTDTTINPTGLAADTWYYVYAIDTAGALSFEYNTTIPVVYMGTAKQKSGDSSRRYVGGFKTMVGSTNIMAFRRDRGRVFWKPSQNAGNMFEASWLMGSKTSTAVSTFTPTQAPSGAKSAYVMIQNGCNEECLIGEPANLNVNDYDLWIENTSDTNAYWIPLNDSGGFGARMDGTPTSGSADFYCLGYSIER